MEGSRAPQVAPRTAVVWHVLRFEIARRAGTSLSIVDVGGGTGGFAVPLAEAGHRVTVVDASPDALAALTRRAADAGVADRVTALQGDADDLPTLVAAGTADLVLCHSLLEMVDDPARVAASLAAVLAPGGAASVLVANRVAAVLSRAIGGHLAAAADLLGAAPDRPTRRHIGPGAGRDGTLRRFDTDTITALLTGAGLTVERVHGVRVVADLVPGALLDVDAGSPAALVEFELAAASRPPYRDIATQLHLLARRA